MLSGELAEEKKEAPAGKKRKIAFGVVAISAVGLLVISGAITALLKWAFGFVFVAGLLGGGWYLGRNKWRALRASKGQKKPDAIEAKVADNAKAKAQAQTVEEQLAALKKKRDE